MEKFDRDPLTEKIIGCCFEVHRILGPGFNEKVYANALSFQLQQENLSFVVEKEFNVVFKGQLAGKFRVDLFVENSIIVELKAIVGYAPALFKSQVLSYLKASKVKTGLLVNFGNASCEVKRISL
jgi:GxxExxY protein